MYESLSISDNQRYWEYSCPDARHLLFLDRLWPSDTYSHLVNKYRRVKHSTRRNGECPMQWSIEVQLLFLRNRFIVHLYAAIAFFMYYWCIAHPVSVSYHAVQLISAWKSLVWRQAGREYWWTSVWMLFFYWRNFLLDSCGDCRVLVRNK